MILLRCSVCSGSGRRVSGLCQACRGSGSLVLSDDYAEVQPAGKDAPEYKKIMNTEQRQAALEKGEDPGVSKIL